MPQTLAPVVVGYFNELMQSPTAGAGAPTLKPIATSIIIAVSTLVSHVFAGKPTSGDDRPGNAVDLGRHVMRDPSNSFVMKATDWSTREARIAALSLLHRL